MTVAPEQIRVARTLLRLERAELARRPLIRQDPEVLCDELPAIGLASAEHLQDHCLLTNADLYNDEDGVPA